VGNFIDLEAEIVKSIGFWRRNWVSFGQSGIGKIDMREKGVRRTNMLKWNEKITRKYNRSPKYTAKEGMQILLLRMAEFFGCRIRTAIAFIRRILLLNTKLISSALPAFIEIITIQTSSGLIAAIHYS